MTFSIYTDSISPHQVPLAKWIAAQLGQGDFRYMYFNRLTEARKKLGWKEELLPWMRFTGEQNDECQELLLRSDVLLTGERSKDILDVFEKREVAGLNTIYMSERWFKPPYGILRFFKPGFLKMALRIVRQIKHNPKFMYFPIGIHAAQDMARLIGLLSGNIFCLFGAPQLRFESSPCGRVMGGAKFYTDKMRMWGYFVESSTKSEWRTRSSNERPFRVLWVGRFLKLKHLQDVIRAVVLCHEGKGMSIELDVYGEGDDRGKYEAFVQGKNYVRIHHPVPMSEVRALMRNHDVYVFSSNGYDGWGAVVSEALEEGMCVIGTSDSGASATLLPPERQYPCGDVNRLVRILSGQDLRGQGIGSWSAESAAKALVAFLPTWMRKECA